MRQSTSLGGRLSLLDPAGFEGAQRRLADDIEANWIPWADSVPFRSKDAEGKLIGPYNPLLRSPEIATSFLALQKVEEKATSLGARVRQVVILSIGSIWKSPYELYAHRAVAAKAGFSKQTIDALAQGKPTAELSGDETLAQQFALRLSIDRHVDQALFEQARNMFGEKGVVDLVALVGCYVFICALLNAFEVPAP